MRRYARLVLTNMPVEGTTKDGFPCHATVSPKLLQAVHGDDFAANLASIAEALGEDVETVIAKGSSGYALKDFEADLVIQYCLATEDSPGDDMSFEDALLLALPPSEEEIAHYIRRVRLPDDFAEEFRKATGEAPSDEDISATIRQMAIRDALDKGNHQLMGLSQKVLDEIAGGHIAVYVVGPRSDGSRTRRNEKPIPMGKLAKLVYGGRNDSMEELPDDFVSGAARGICLTTPFTNEGTVSYRWICYVERPTSKRRGFLIAFPLDTVTDAIRTKHDAILEDFPNKLRKGRYPACPWRERRERPHRISKDRRHPYAPWTPREDAGTKEEPTPPEPDQDPNNQEPDQDNDDSEPSEADEST